MYNGCVSIGKARRVGYTGMPQGRPTPFIAARRAHVAAAGAVSLRWVGNHFCVKEGIIVSNRLFQGIIHQMKDAIDRTIGIIDETSSVIACSELGRIGEPSGVEFAEVVEAASGCLPKTGLLTIPLGQASTPNTPYSWKGRMNRLANTLIYWPFHSARSSSITMEKYDRGNFIKNVIL